MLFRLLPIIIIIIIANVIIIIVIVIIINIIIIISKCLYCPETVDAIQSLSATDANNIEDHCKMMLGRKKELSLDNIVEAWFKRRTPGWNCVGRFPEEIHRAKKVDLSNKIYKDNKSDVRPRDCLLYTSRCV